MVRSTASLEAEFQRITPGSRAQWEKGMPVMPGGIMKEGYWSRPYPIYIDRADGCYLWASTAAATPTSPTTTQP